ncbi:hypothetical protein LCGC14_1617410 [marine sediment metagenome]|uniref:LamG-like jellyroll fold domain-containing protein n=1 Tax=marine sediment metagenome TaxID=412755 RepID=A0A0F9I6H8_9ZZZZ
MRITTISYLKKLLIILILTVTLKADIRPSMLSFNGEFSPLLHMRSDFSKYDSGCALLQNFLPLTQGPVFRRPGMRFIAETQTMIERSRLASFVFNKTDTYILEFGDLYMRVYRDGGQVILETGTETIPSDLTSFSISQWKLNDATNTTAVIDSVGSPTHQGTATTNTVTLSVTGQLSNAFDLQGIYAVDIADHDDFTFDDSADEGFSIVAWIYVEPSNHSQVIISKYDADVPDREWFFYLDSNEQLVVILADDNGNINSYQLAVYFKVLSEGWYNVAFTYDGRGGSAAADGIKMYVNSESVILSRGYGDLTYSQMRNTSANVVIGAELFNGVKGEYWENKLDNIAIFNTELTSSQINSFIPASSTFQLTTTYTENEVGDLQFVQVSDIMYIVHENHEPRKLSRAGHTDWTIIDINYEDGPFLDENASPTYTIAPSGLTGGITLTASTNTFIANDVGALMQVRHPRDDAILAGRFSTASQSISIPCEGDFRFTTHGTWVGKLDLQRTRNDGLIWETVPGGHFTSSADSNVSYSGNEPDPGYEYRVIMASRTSGAVDYDFIVFEGLHTGVARISAYTSATVVSATVTTTMGSTTATTYWSEGHWSPKNGFPATVEFHQFRLFYGGSRNYPQTIWATKVEDYELMKTGTDADDALVYLFRARTRFNGCYRIPT